MRRNVGVFILVAAGVAVGTALQGRLTAQASQATQGPDILPALLVEVRGLRAAMEDVASAGPRVQLALGRLQLQEQRVNNLLRRLEAARASLAAAQKADDNIRQEVAMLEEMARSGAVPEIERAQRENQHAALKTMLGRAAGELQRLQVEESGIVQELGMEQGRWSDINRQMEELERALGKK